MLSLHLLAISLILGWIQFLWSRRYHYALMLKMSGPKGYPLIGMALELLQGERGQYIATGFEKYFKQYGGVFLSWIGPIPIMIIGEPKVAQDILTSQHCITKSPCMYKVVKEVFGIGLVTSEGAMWSQHRKMLNPAFKHNVLISFLPIFNKETKYLLQLMDTYVDKGGHDLTKVLKNFTLKIATQTTMGSNVQDEENFKNKTLLRNYEQILEIGNMLIFSPLLNFKPLRQFWKNEKPFSEAKANIRNFVLKMVQQKCETHTSSNQSTIFVDQAMKQLSDGKFSFKDVADECYTIVFAAFETTYNSINFTLMLLAMFPQYQERVFEELEEIFPDAAGDFDVTYEDIQKMEYLQRVLSESMRLMAPIPLIGRYSSQDVKLSNGVVLPKGTNIGISIYHIHRNKDIWGPQANTFDPDNFLPNNIQDKHPYAYIPFVKGTRNCIGWRYALILAKTTLAKLLRNYKFHTDFRYENLYPVVTATLKLKEYPLLTLERRV